MTLTVRTTREPADVARPREIEATGPSTGTGRLESVVLGPFDARRRDDAPRA